MVVSDLTSTDDNCVLLPACPDLPSFSSCALCFSKYICHNSWQFLQLDEDAMEAVERVRYSLQSWDELRILSDIADEWEQEAGTECSAQSFSSSKPYQETFVGDESAPLAQTPQSKVKQVSGFNNSHESVLQLLTSLGSQGINAAVKSPNISVFHSNAFEVILLLFFASRRLCPALVYVKS